MHELGVVFHIVKQLNEVAEENALTKIAGVTLQLGEVSTVIPSYLEDCWKWSSDKSDLLRGAKLTIERIPAITYCEDCQQTYSTVQYAKKCPHCGSENTYLQQGNEFMIKEIEAC